MAIDKFLDGKCAIYHLSTSSPPSGNGTEGGVTLPGHQQKEYPSVPDLDDIPCHFGRRGKNASLNQESTRNMLVIMRPLYLPFGTDIRITDKVIDKATGLAYTVNDMDDIYDDHTKALLYRTNGQAAI